MARPRNEPGVGSADTKRRVGAGSALSAPPAANRAPVPPDVGDEGAAGRRSGRAARVGRRETILAAALAEFSARGFAATRIDDVARRAGIAKGTIYLYFRDKENLFEELVRAMLGPLVAQIEKAPILDLPVRAVIDGIVDLLIREVFGTDRKDVIRLVLTEGPRFPTLAEFYYHEVIERVIGAMRAILARAVARGELGNDVLVRFPQLLVAPALVAIMWGSLFDRFAPLDVRALMQAHLDLLFGERNAP
jgi:AcrR family transcriptional regulator